MVILIALVAAFLLFFVIRKHIGIMHLAMLAGLGVYEMFGDLLTNWFKQFTGDMETELLKMIIYLVLVLGFPLLLFLKSSNSGLFGILRTAESLITAIVIATLIAKPLAFFCPFDALANQVYDFIKTIENPVLLASIITAYLDILLTRRL